MTSLPDIIGDLPVLDALTTAVICLDDGLRIHYLNTAAEQLLSMSASKALGLHLIHAVNIPDALIVRLREAIKTGQPYIDRQVFIEPYAQEPIQIDCHISPFHSELLRQGLILELTAVDLPLRIARDEAMQAQQEHAQSLLRGLAHEIKNPLGGLRGAAQLLERQLPDQELHEYTSIIIREADRLQSLIDRMLGPVTRPRKDVVNLHEALEHVRKITRVGAPAAVQFLMDYDPSIPECRNDRDRLVQVFLNIANNAKHAVGDSGTITFRTRVQSNFTIFGKQHPLVASVQIHDTGHGVPEHLIDQIFYPMVTGTDEGTGLGLSIAQSMMNQIGGLIECQSESGNTAFTVLIPLEQA